MESKVFLFFLSISPISYFIFSNDYLLLSFKEFINSAEQQDYFYSKFLQYCRPVTTEDSPVGASPLNFSNSGLSEH